MDGRIISQNEFDIIFYEELTQLQVNHIFRIIFILAKHVLLTTDMLMQIYQVEYNEKLGLSYLKRAVKDKLIVEYKDDLDETSEKNIFYYSLKSSIFAYLKQNNIPFLKLPPSAAFKEKSRLLTFNKYATKQGFTMNMQMQLDFYLRYFVTNQGVICYFEDCISKEQIKAELQKRKNEIEYKYVKIPSLLFEVGKHTRAVNPRDID